MQQALGEVVYPHAPDASPVSAVKNVQLQTSLAQLKAGGLYERYLEGVDPSVPERITSELPMVWMPIELACEHYRACDNMVLTVEELAGMGARVGDRMQKHSLTASARNSQEPEDVWSVVGALHRMWARHYQGGSVQVTKLGPFDMLLEQRGFVINQFRYYRQAQLTAVKVSFEAIGARLTTLKIASYSVARDELTMNLGWA